MTDRTKPKTRFYERVRSVMDQWYVPQYGRELTRAEDPRPPSGPQLTITDTSVEACQLCTRPVSTGVDVRCGDRETTICDGCVEELVDHARPLSLPGREVGR